MRRRRGSSPHTRGAPSIYWSAISGRRIIPAYAGSTACRRRPDRTGRDHPRIRGEHSDLRVVCHDIPGSSPHTRGAPLNSKFPSGLCRDHPRIRGEHDTKPPARAGCRGSSPHTRGAPVRRHPAWREVRIIPAYAGSTGHDTSRSTKGQDHPRIRGEHSSPISESSSRRGSSPHTRGARGRSRPSPCPPRIIPAYAGSTTRIADLLRDSGDHPRIRGEHPSIIDASVVVAWIIPAYAGSTRPGGSWPAGRPDHPRIRGEHVLDPRASWLTPGSSPHTRGARRHAPPHRRRRWDHPRIRGEHHAFLERHREARGSSPHTRGARESFRQRREDPGIIPAYAGSTPHWSPDRWRQWDHPRIRGEHVPGTSLWTVSRGSSPHTRGAQECGHLRQHVRGIIPAYAGSTSSARSGW